MMENNSDNSQELEEMVNAITAEQHRYAGMDPVVDIKEKGSNYIMTIIGWRNSHNQWQKARRPIRLNFIKPEKDV